MYIYESHMGGLYATEEELDWEDLYCEQCGDSDSFMECATTIEEAWTLLKPETSGFGVCDICEQAKEEEDTLDDSDPFAFPKCCMECDKEDARFGVWEFSYIMNFLEEYFPCKNPIHVYIIAKNTVNDSIFVNMKPRGHKFGEKHELPHLFCVDKDVVTIATESCCTKLDYPDMSTLKLTKKVNNDYYFEVIDTSEVIEDSAHHMDDGWYGWIPKGELKL